MKAQNYKKNEFIEIIDVDQIKQGDTMWENGDVVQIKDVEPEEERIEVWDKEKYLSELIYENEFKGIRKV